MAENSVQHHWPDGEPVWLSAEPEPADTGFSAELEGTGPYTVDAWHGDDWILHATTRTKVGAFWRIWRTRRRALARAK